ncbi:MAG: hypothetical protein JW914_02060 [Syntrophaceae bacterium]|nr:hypothetical protein [Syntrophaceae bacterium]
MKKVLVIFFIMFSISVANADTFYKLVGYKCNKISNSITISYLGAYNEAGEEMMKNKGPQQWDPWELIATMKDEDHIGSLKTIKRNCILNDGTYTITIGPSPGSLNIQGACGGWIRAWAEVKRDSKVILPQYYFEAWCSDTQTPVTTAITIKAGKNKPIIKTIPWDEFYK